MSISEPGTDYTCDGADGEGGACSPFTESLPAALPAAAFTGGSEATFCLASSSAGQDLAPITAASPDSAGGGVFFLHGDALAPTPAPPAGSNTSTAAAPAAPAFGSSITDANAQQQKSETTCYLAAASVSPPPPPPRARVTGAGFRRDQRAISLSFVRPWRSRRRPTATRYGRRRGRVLGSEMGD